MNDVLDLPSCQRLNIERKNNGTQTFCRFKHQYRGGTSQ